VDQRRQDEIWHIQYGFAPGIGKEQNVSHATNSVNSSGEGNVDRANRVGSSTTGNDDRHL